LSTELEAEFIRLVLESYGIEVLFRASLPGSVYPGLAPIKVLVQKRSGTTRKYTQDYRRQINLLHSKKCEYPLICSGEHLMVFCLH